MRAEEMKKIPVQEFTVRENMTRGESIDEKLMQTAATLLVKISLAAESFVDQEVTPQP